MLCGVWILSQPFFVGYFRRLLFLWGFVSLWHEPILLNAASSLLRNPEIAVFELFPDAHHYQSHNAYISVSNQAKVEDQLKVPLSFSDLGQQTILLIFSKDNLPLGMIHVRSEIGPTGVIELVWVMNLDFTLTGMKVQRSRGTQVVFLNKPDFQTHLLGKNAEQLLELLVLDYSSVNPDVISVPEKVAPLAQKAILCAAKSLLITQETFGQELLRYRLVNTLFKQFPETQKVQEVHSDSSPMMVQNFGALVPPPPSGFCGLRGYDGQGNLTGMVIFDRWLDQATSPEVWWMLDPNLFVRDMKFVPSNLPLPDLAFWEPLKGKPLNQFNSVLSTSRFQVQTLLEPIVRKLESIP